MLEQNPDLFMLWQGDNISNLLSPDLCVASPFVLTMTLEAEEQVSTQNEATRKFFDLDKRPTPLMASSFPAWANRPRSGGRCGKTSTAIAAVWCAISST